MFFGYAYRWLRPKDPMYTDSLLRKLKCPIRAQEPAKPLVQKSTDD